MSTFAERLTRACDDNPDIPAEGAGRQVALQKALGVSQEAVRKWFKGEARPRPEKMRELATFLRVDESWLALGIKADVSREERRQRTRASEGAALLVMGLVRLAGGTCAEPSDKDPRRGHVDFYTIINGQQHAICAVLAREVAPGKFSTIVPREYEDARVIVVIPAGRNRFDFIEMPAEDITRHKTPKTGDYAVSFARADRGQYATGRHQWPLIRGFEELS